MVKELDKQNLLKKLKNILNSVERADELEREINETVEQEKVINQELKGQVDDLEKRIEGTNLALNNIRAQITHEQEKAPECPSESNGGIWLALAVTFIVFGIFLAIVLAANETDAWPMGIIVAFFGGGIFLPIGGAIKSSYNYNHQAYLKKDTEHRAKIDQLRKTEKECLEKLENLTSIHKAKAAEYEEKKAELDVKLASLDDKRAAVEQLRREAAQAMPDEIPGKYKALHFIKSLADYLSNDLVDSMREAILMYRNEIEQQSLWNEINSVKWEIRRMTDHMERSSRESNQLYDVLQRELQTMSAEQERLQRESNYLMQQNLAMQEQMQQNVEKISKRFDN